MRMGVSGLAVRLAGDFSLRLQMWRIMVCGLVLDLTLCCSIFLSARSLCMPRMEADGTQTGGIRTFLTNRRWISFSLLLSWVE